MNESIEYFGVGGEQLLGILHKGAVWEQALKSPAVIFWNVGVSHRI